MRDIHCPKDVGLQNIFDGEDCKTEQLYNDCFHCWSSAIGKRCNQERQRDADIVKSYITESGTGKDQHTNEVLRKIINEIMIHEQYG